MINNKINVSRFDGIIPCSSSPDRSIPGGPLYPRDEVLLLSQANKIELWSVGSIRDAEKWELDQDSIAGLITSAMQAGAFKSSEWCLQGSFGPWAACDVYIVTRFEWYQYAYKDIATEYYLKFAISKTGRMLLTVSNHPGGA